MVPQALTSFNTARYMAHLHILEMKWNWLIKWYTCKYIYIYIHREIDSLNDIHVCVYIYIYIYFHLQSNVHLTFDNIILFWRMNVPRSLSILCTGIHNSHDSRVYKSDSNLHILFTFFPALVSYPSVFIEKYTSG